jgi:DNA-binding beta-propeller fold protein YncE
MNVRQARVRLVQMGVALAAAALIAGCGSQYRSVVTPVNPTGPAGQPESRAVVVSSSSTTDPGHVTIIDYSGDSVMASVSLLGIGATSLALDGSGSTGYTINSNGTMTSFPAVTTLQYKNESYLTLPTDAEAVNLFAPTSSLWITDRSTGSTDIETGSPQSFVDAVSVGSTPIMTIGASSSGSRNYTLAQNIANASGLECNASPTTQAAGQVTGIEISTTGYTADSPIPVGKCPVYAVQSSDGKRIFVINRGSDTVSVINVTKNAIDDCTPFTNPAGQSITCHPTLPLSLGAVKATGITPFNGTTGMTQTAGPVYAEYNATNSQLIVADYDGGTISVIDVPLDEYGNDSNTYDASGNITGGFGKTHTIKVGNNPASVTVLVDGSRAYTANQADSTVSIVNLSSFMKEKADLAVVGHPRTVVSTQNSIYGKVYVASTDTNVITIISVEDDTVDTTLSVLGNVVDARVSSQNGTTSSNNNNVSRVPGFGQPCNLPISEFDPTATGATLAGCQAQVATTSAAVAKKK